MTNSTLTRPRPTARQLDRPAIASLGTTVAVWAHPDDETYLAGGLLAALRDAGQQVVCVTATRGDAGSGLHDGGTPEARSALAAVRTSELTGALNLLGVAEHSWLDYRDTECAEVPAEEAVARLSQILAEVRPDTVISFGPDGFTGHSDHRAVARWTQLAVDRCHPRPRLLQAVRTEADARANRDVDDNFDIYVWGSPPRVPEEDLAVRVVLDGGELTRKVAALRHQHSQTAALVEALGVERFAEWVSAESFRAA
jgi:LmbE family N-acetylglucosaminyl deacetylase